MVHYKFTYFNCEHGSGEIVYLVFALAGQEYEDVRVEYQDWPALQPTTPFGKLPLLEEDGKVIAQSNAIARYLARKFGFAGKNNWEQAQVDAFVDQTVDLRTETQKFFSTAFGFAEGDLAQLKTDVLEPALKKNLPFFNNALQKNGTGFIVGDEVTWADLAIASFTAVLLDKAPETLDGYEELKTHEKKIFSIPNIKAWIEKRPVTNF